MKLKICLITLRGKKIVLKKTKFIFKE